MTMVLKQRAPHERIPFVERELVVGDHIVTEVALDLRQRVVTGHGETARVPLTDGELHPVVDRLAILALLVHLADAGRREQPPHVGAARVAGSVDGRVQLNGSTSVHGVRAHVRGARHQPLHQLALEREIVVVRERCLIRSVERFNQHRQRERGLLSPDRRVGDEAEIGATPIGIREGARRSDDGQPKAPRWRIHRAVAGFTVAVLVVEHAAATTKAGLAVVAQCPRKTGASAQVVRRRVGAVLGDARVAAEEFPPRRLREHC